MRTECDSFMSINVTSCFTRSKIVEMSISIRYGTLSSEGWIFKMDKTRSDTGQVPDFELRGNIT